MIDVSKKDVVLRIARARGFIKLSERSLRRIREGSVEKGDVISVAKVSAINAVKKTPEILLLCHPIPIEGVRVDVSVEEKGISVEVEVRAHHRTGVEMDALFGVSAALLNIWDMVKRYEKDERGLYPGTSIESIAVVEKIKGTAEEK